jgi:hypothetical protein
MSANALKVKEKKDRYKVCYMAGDDSGFDMMEGALLVRNPSISHRLGPR